MNTALKKGLTFCPTPKGPGKSEIWNDFKEFHRRLELVQFFRPNVQSEDNNLGISQNIIDFMNANQEQDNVEQDTTTNYNDIHKSYKIKSSWRPNPPNKTLDTFKRAFKMNLLESKGKHKTYNNLTKRQ